MTTSSVFSYVPEPNNPFLSLFPHRYDFIQAALPEVGKKPTWRTESRHPLSDRLWLQGGSLFGVRFGAETCYCLLDVDIGSRYHPRQDTFALALIQAALEPLGLCASVVCTSSHSGGLHLYFPFTQAQPSWRLASAIETLLTAAGFKLQGGQLEVFPNTKQFVTEGSPSLFNAHRLPLQEPGSHLLNDGLEPIWSSQERFIELWQACQARSSVSSKKLTCVLKQKKRARHLASEKANKFLNDLNAEINQGWTGDSQTNDLLGRIAMRCFVFHHILVGGEPLTGQALVDEIVATAIALDGYKTWCGHQQEITKRATDWARCIENSHYFPYGTQKGKYKPQTITENPQEPGWHQTLAIATQAKIREAVQVLRTAGQFPDAITQRFKILSEQGIGTSSLYRYKKLWHPKHESSESKPFEPRQPVGLQECPLLRPEGASNRHNPASLLEDKSRNCITSKHLSDCGSGRAEPRSRNEFAEQDSVPFAAPSLDFSNLDSQGIIDKTKQWLQQASLEQPWKPSEQPSSPVKETEGQKLAAARTNAFIERHLGYLASGEPILIREALNMLLPLVEELNGRQWPPLIAEAFARQLKPLQVFLRSPQVAILPTESANLTLLLDVFQQLLRLGWEALFIQQTLQERFGKQSVGALSQDELQRWLEILNAL